MDDFYFKENNCTICPKVFCCRKCRQNHELIVHKKVHFEEIVVEKQPKLLKTVLGFVKMDNPETPAQIETPAFDQRKTENFLKNTSTPLELNQKLYQRLENVTEETQKTSNSKRVSFSTITTIQSSYVQESEISDMDETCLNSSYNSQKLDEICETNQQQMDSTLWQTATETDFENSEIEDDEEPPPNESESKNSISKACEGISNAGEEILNDGEDNSKTQKQQPQSESLKDIPNSDEENIEKSSTMREDSCNTEEEDYKENPKIVLEEIIEDQSDEKTASFVVVDVLNQSKNTSLSSLKDIWHSITETIKNALNSSSRTDDDDESTQEETDENSEKALKRSLDYSNDNFLEPKAKRRKFGQIKCRPPIHDVGTIIRFRFDNKPVIMFSKSTQTEEIYFTS